MLSYRGSGGISPALTHLECHPFASPELPSGVAPVVWLPDRSLTTITARADLCDNFEDRDFSLERISIRAHVHFDAVGRQLVLLQSDTHQITVIVEGRLVTLGSVRLHFASSTLHRLERYVDALQTLLHVLHLRKLAGPPLRPGPVDALRYRNAIIAIDGERAGASRREIAAVIYGDAQVAHEWNRSDRLKAMVKRDVRRGRRLLAGGWRDLIAGGSVRLST